MSLRQPIFKVVVYLGVLLRLMPMLAEPSTPDLTDATSPGSRSCVGDLGSSVSFAFLAGAEGPGLRVLQRTCAKWNEMLNLRVFCVCVFCAGESGGETVAVDVFQHFANAPGPEPFFHPREKAEQLKMVPGIRLGARSLHLQELPGCKCKCALLRATCAAHARLAKLLRDIRAETPPVSSRSVPEAQGVEAETPLPECQ